jgi:RNase adapter protein RapZ
MTHPVITASRDAAPQASARGPGAAKKRLLLVTGLSGAGHSSALKALEDMGYEAVDNLPLFLLGGLVEHAAMLARPIAIGVDSRTRDFSVTALNDHVTRLRGLPGLDVKLLYLDCSDDVLQRRFKETRRRHPLAADRPVIDGIAQERTLLAPLRHLADVAIDTSELRLGDLKQILGGHFAVDRAVQAQIAIVSFSYREGLPREADLVFDVRFLRNPHYEESLRPHTGCDAAVADFIEADPAFAPFFTSLTNMLAPLLPAYDREGKSYVTIAIGCTGGRHRSVHTAERLAAWLKGQGRSAHLRHRDIAISSNPSSTPVKDNPPAAG